MTLQELEEFYKGRELPATAQLYKAIKIIDVPKFVDSHFTVLKANSHSKAFQPFYDRLILLKEILEKGEPN